MSRLPDGAEVRVIHGRGSVEELVGVLLALDRAAGEEAPRPPPSAGWARAGRLEGVGAGRFAAAVDLAVLR